MDKTLKDYDKNLEDLEIQRTKLENVMKMMGQEWEESGAGIGWLGSLDLVPIIQETKQDTSIKAEAAQTITTTTTSNNNNNNANDKSISLPFSSNILSESTGPSPEYLQSLLNVNDTLLAQSLANHSNATPMLTHIEDQLSDMLINTTDCLSSPLLTPTTNTDSDYMENANPHSEMVISPLESIKFTTSSDTTIANTTTI
ncbi:hypothetical protein INT48_006284 [Thamnidium elegans]|uniref:Uncharacterized protein n=1 Tax=Thamnidium elegans TaxID=101142 RepID=A0A8H7SL33_9FUNG|nr:hypothetical protein INT48_006284 [Thamnidium elegans]